MYKKIFDTLLNHPLIFSILIVDFFILLLHKPPFAFSFLMLGVLIGASLFLGQKMELFK